MSKASLTVTGLFHYPIKGCGGRAVTTLGFDELGPCDDRRWMLVDGDGRMVSQRGHPSLARIRLASEETGWTVSADGHGTLSLARRTAGARRTPFEVWGDRGEGLDAGDEAAAWFSAFLDLPVRLVAAPVGEARQRERGGRRFAFGFADGYPLLLCHEASLEALNRSLAADGAAPVPMSRFRPNIVLAGGEASAELAWSALETPVGRLDLATPCVRCSVTTVDQGTGRRPAPSQPLAALARLPGAQVEGGVVFGRNAFALPAGTALAVGMALHPVPGES